MDLVWELLLRSRKRPTSLRGALLLHKATSRKSIATFSVVGAYHRYVTDTHHISAVVAAAFAMNGRARDPAAAAAAELRSSERRARAFILVLLALSFERSGIWRGSPRCV